MRQSKDSKHEQSIITDYVYFFIIKVVTDKLTTNLPTRCITITVSTGKPFYQLTVI